MKFYATKKARISSAILKVWLTDSAQLAPQQAMSIPWANSEQIRRHATRGRTTAVLRHRGKTIGR
jgi:hypothetical protein